LRQACLDEALAIIETSGVEALSLREVSRRLGVSHQAPYRHFASRDHILAELLSGSFEVFAAHLKSRPGSAAPPADLQAMGEAYLDFARAHPTRYRLMFSTPMPDPERFPEMMSRARAAFGLLEERLATMPSGTASVGDPSSPKLDALFVWATIHGLAGILNSEVMIGLAFTEHERAAAVGQTLARIGLGLGLKDAG
jgi:AcrR family transcriptional regulator